MATRTDRTAAKQPLTPTMWVLIVVVLLALVGASLFVVMSLLGDEPPIRVRNGSMEVVLGQGEWKDDGDAWTPSEGRSGKGFTVTVVSANGHACQNGQTGSGKEAWILYSGKTEFSFRFAGLFNPKTKVRPKDTLTRVTPQMLRHGQPGDQGYIIGVGTKDGANTWSCTFTSREQLSEIILCPRQGVTCP
jgi:hypothetical protein